MSEALLSVPKLDDSSSSASFEMITKFALLSIENGAKGKTTTLDIPFQVSHIYFYGGSGRVRYINAKDCDLVTEYSQPVYDGATGSLCAQR